MTMQSESTQKIKILDEIIDNAIMLPVESQDLLLMMAKAMRHTRNCMAKKASIEQQNESLIDPTDRPA